MPEPVRGKEPISVTESVTADGAVEVLPPSSNDRALAKLNVQGYQINELVRFRALAAAVCAGICVSMVFGFGLIADFMRTTFHYDQRQLTTITTTGLVVGFFTFPFGAIFDYAGPRPLFVIGSTMVAFGTLMFALTFSGFVAPSVALFAFYIAVLNLGCGLFDVASVPVLMDLFPLNRGPIAAIVKTTTGLGTSVLAAMYSGFFDGNDAHYLYFMIGVVIFIGSILCYCIRLPPYVITGYEEARNSPEELNARKLTKEVYMTTPPPMTRILYGYAVMILLLVFLTTVSIANIYLNISRTMHLSKAVVTVIIMLLFAGMAAPLSCMGGMKKVYDKNASSSSNEHLDSEELVVIGDSVMPKDGLPGMYPQYDTSFWRSFLSIDSWCYFWISFWAWGAGLTLVVNVSEIFHALNPSVDRKTIFLYVALNGIGSALGRLGLALVETLLTRYTKALAKRGIATLTPMTIAYPAGSLLLVIGYVLFLVLPGKAIVIASIVASAGYGYNATCSAVIVRTLWSKDSGKFYNLTFTGSMLSAVVLNRFLFGELYDAASIANGSKVHCVGRNCVQTCFIVIAFGCATSAVAAIIIHIRFVRFLLAKRKANAEARTDGVAA